VPPLENILSLFTIETDDFRRKIPAIADQPLTTPQTDPKVFAELLENFIQNSQQISHKREQNGTRHHHADTFGKYLQPHENLLQDYLPACRIWKFD